MFKIMKKGAMAMEEMGKTLLYVALLLLLILLVGGAVMLIKKVELPF